MGPKEGMDDWREKTEEGGEWESGGCHQPCTWKAICFLVHCTWRRPCFLVLNDDLPFSRGFIHLLFQSYIMIYEYAPFWKYHSTLHIRMELINNILKLLQWICFPIPLKINVMRMSRAMKFIGVKSQIFLHYFYGKKDKFGCITFNCRVRMMELERFFGVSAWLWYSCHSINIMPLQGPD